MRWIKEAPNELDEGMFKQDSSIPPGMQGIHFVTTLLHEIHDRFGALRHAGILHRLQDEADGIADNGPDIPDDTQDNTIS